MAAQAAPIPKPKRSSLPSSPPTPDDAKDNLEANVRIVEKRMVVKPKGFDGPPKQLNIRIDPKIHAEIKIAAVRAGTDMGDYLVSLHNQATKGA